MRLDFCQATLFLRVCSGWFCMWVVWLYIAARDSFFFRHILLLLLLLMSRSLSPPFNRKTHYGRIALFTCAIFILAPYTNGTMKIAHTQTDIHTHTIIIIIDILTILSTIPNPCSFANWVFNSIFSPFHFSHSLPFFGFRCKCFARCVTPHHSSVAIRQSFWTFPMIYKLRSFVIVGDVGMHEIERQRARHMKIIW